MSHETEAGKKLKMMGAVLWSILALISVLVSLPINHGASSDGQQPFDSHDSLYRRRSAESHYPSYRANINDGTGGDWSCEQCCNNESSCDLKISEEEKFLSLVNESFDSLSRPVAGGPLVLVHIVRECLQVL